MTILIDKQLTLDEMDKNGYLCDEIRLFIEKLIRETDNQVEICGLENLKAPDPKIYVKSRIDYEWAKSYVDQVKGLGDDRSKSRTINRVYCVDHHSAQVEYDWRSKEKMKNRKER